MSDKDKRSALFNAYDYLMRTGQSIRKTARMYGVAESTLRTRISNPSLLHYKMGHPTLFSRSEETQLAEHCKKMARVGYGYCRWQVMDMANNMVKATGRLETPKKDWYYGFVKRFPDLAIQKPKKREVARVRGSTEVNINNYFKELESILDKYKIKNKPELIWNVDETGIKLDHTPPKVLAPRNEKPFVVTAGHSATTTVIAAGSALGETIPPYVIYKGQRLTSELATGCLTGTKFAMTETGWSNSWTFLDFIQNHFIQHVKSRPCLLLYDGHSTHITVEVIEKARENNIHMFVLPPHSSHQLQPLDVGIFSPFKSALSSECHKLSHSKVGRQITREDLPTLIACSFKSALTVPNLMSAFRKTGIVPFNPDAVLPKPVETTPDTQPKSRKERANVRSIKLLLHDVNEKVDQALSTTVDRSRKYVIPPCGTAITENEFLEKLKEPLPEKKARAPKRKLFETPWKGKGPEDKQSVEKSSSSGSRSTELAKSDKQKEKAGQTNKGSKSKQPAKPRKNKLQDKGKENCSPEVIDSQEAGPSNSKRKEWLTFYDSQSQDDEDDDEVCCICNAFVPPAFVAVTRKTRRVEFVAWAKCDTCRGWVHLKYCSPVETVGQGEPFVCPNC